MLTPSAVAGKVKFRARSKITGVDLRMLSLTMGRKTSASSKKVVVSDQLRADTLMAMLVREKPSDSILVKGHGPAIQDTLAFRNSFPSPASKKAEPIAAFHFPSGEHGWRPLQGTLPVLSTWNIFTALPMFTDVVALMEYLAETLAITISGRLCALVD